VSELALPAQPFTVASVSERMPDRLEPFGLRAPEPTRRGGFLAPALAGSLATLLALAGVSAWRRGRERRRARGRSEAPDDAQPWTSADAELAAALARLDDDAHAAADATAMALRRYASRRALRPVEALTTEELAAQAPPGRLRSRWPALLDLLRRLDALRFPGGLERAESRSALRELIGEARAFVSDSIPPRELR